jgi:predicted alpha/beta superfamily hydrolase
MTRIARVTLAAAAMAIPAVAQGQDSTPVAIPGTRAFALESMINGRDYRLLVALPESYADGDTTRYPVLYVLDGNTLFGLATDTHRALRIFQEVADVVIVGIGYDAGFFMDTFVSRWTDYTPSRDISADTSFARRFLSDRAESVLRSGGGAQFLQVLRQEVIPFVDARFRTTRDRGLWGHSFGGLFALHVLFEQPDLFARYAISSPSLWWNQQEMIAREANYARDLKALSGRVYLSVGSQEDQQLFETFTATLRARGYEHLELASHVFEGETHASVVPAAMSRSLRFLHGITPRR